MAKRRKDDEDYRDAEYPAAEPLAGDTQEPDNKPDNLPPLDDQPSEEDRIKREEERLKEEAEVDPATVAPTKGGAQVYRMEQTGRVRGETVEKGQTVVLTPEEASRLATGGVQLSWAKEDQVPEDQRPDYNPNDRPMGTAHPADQPDADEMPVSDPPARAGIPPKGPSFRK